MVLSSSRAKMFVNAAIVSQKARSATSEEERAKRDLAEAESTLKSLEEAAKAVRGWAAWFCFCCLRWQPLLLSI